MTWVLVICLAFHMAVSHPFSFIIRDGQLSRSNPSILLTHGSPRSFPPTSSLGSLFSLPLFSQLRNPSLRRSFEFDPTGPSVYPSLVQEPNLNQALRGNSRQIAFTTPIPIKTEKMVLPESEGSTSKSVPLSTTLYREDTNVHNYLKKKKKPEVL
ncbi:uncharacterized protein LOC131892416 isoform X2 [Tigriopus californicus]|uniref:uncharacterized protein LOC131892416 isoform X2 n=1 Tax=Tigriopus californicus TaxID=6832 RepID=UPI0027DA8B69|nr:uncharacterized protein LOC131892416 isoform X2 [Tigriopus californicus]